MLVTIVHTFSKVTGINIVCVILTQVVRWLVTADWFVNSLWIARQWYVLIHNVLIHNTEWSSGLLDELTYM